MKDIAFEIVSAGLEAVEPFKAVQAHLHREGNRLICASQAYNLAEYNRILVIGFGKGSAPMAHAVHTLLADRITAGSVIVKYGHTLADDISLGPINIVEAGHPVPDENCVKYTQAIISLLANCREDDLVICLISGGGSALLSSPATGMTLAQIQDLTERLLAVGASITEINTLRKHLSNVKGGQLARLARPAAIISLILSDVANDQLDAIASGPTVADPSTFADALNILDRYQLINKVHPEIISRLKRGRLGKQPETPKPGSPIFERAQNTIIANNHMALHAAVKKARALEINAVAFAPFIEEEARQAAKNIASVAKQLAQDNTLFKKPVALLIGGETTVTLNSDHGLGGRNQELALAIAIEIQGCANLLVACFATDGNDGPTDAAGAMVNGDTVAKAAATGLDADRYLSYHDAYHFFQSIDDLIITGPTNTNVNDIILVLV